ncbi:MAG: STAS domain-containing protein [Nitrospirae bacterium]|nr:STAS domain-containing protein [Nitrospirota bacterium]MDA1305177.1 STAS domain-containing protein [Nitrospirota bacterium]
MHITEHVHDGVWILKVSGSLNFYSRKTFQAVMRNAENGSTNHVIIDLTLVESLDSMGIGLIALSQARLALQGIVLSLVGPHPQVKEVLDMANIPKLIPVYQTEEEAIGLPVSA